jgi:flavin reductase (DIM6/NTAB) family NADH-FMN oxidoreductase RutF
MIEPNFQKAAPRMSAQAVASLSAAPSTVRAMRSPASSLDPRAFRSAVGCFPTGVAVVTTTVRGEEPAGLTVNSFASVSLDPPLVLWCVNKGSDRFGAFTNADEYVVCLLGRDHEDVSSQLARRGARSLSGMDFVPTELGPPALSNSLATFECRKEAIYDGGDHVIIMARVLKFERQEAAEPLVFHNGSYRALAKTA